MEEARQYSAMTGKSPPEVQRFVQMLETILNDPQDSPTLVALSAAAMASSDIQLEESAIDLFATVRRMIDLIEKHPRGSNRSLAALKRRIEQLFAADQLIGRLPDYRRVQLENIQAILDLVGILDDLEIDIDRLLSAMPDIEQQTEAIISRVAKDPDLTLSTQKLVIAQLELVIRALRRFKYTGVGPFRETLYSSIGGVTVIMSDASGSEARALRGVADDLLRVTGVVQAAAGSLLFLTGPAVAGLLTGPAGS